MAFEDRIRAALDRALAEVRAAAESEVGEARHSAELAAAAAADAASRLSDCIHAIDEAPSLGAVLTVTAACARIGTGRAGVVLVRNSTPRAYPSRAEASPQQAQLASRVALTGAPILDLDAAGFPIVVGDQVVAVLVTAAPPSLQIQSTLELLARHAGRTLQARTLLQITGLAPLSSAGAATPEGSAL